MADPNDALAVQHRFRSGGTSQAERLPVALRPELLRPDGRSLPELLAYVARLSEHFLFYDSTSFPNPRGPWGLSRQRSLLLLAVIAEQNNAGLAQAYTADLRPLLDDDTADRPQLLARQRLLQLLRRQVLTLIAWATAHQRTDRQRGFTEALTGVLRRTAPALREAADRERRLHTQDPAALPSIQLTATLLAQVDGLAQVVAPSGEANALDAPASPAAPEVSRRADTGHLLDMLWQLHREQTLLAGVAKEALAGELQAADHRPEMALLVTFLELYRHAQQELNDIPRRHLNYYYEDVLHAAVRPSIPDHTYLAFSLVSGTLAYTLPTGTLAEGVNAAGQRVLFATTEEGHLAAWRVAALATQYVARQPTASGGQVTGIYASAWADPLTDRGPGASALEASWPLFGEDQGGRKAEARTMTDAPVGWAIASPALVLPGGQRTIAVRVYASAASFQVFEQLLADAKATLGRAGEMLLFNTFRVDVTSPTDWCPLLVQQVAVDRPTQSICWSLLLSSTKPAASSYDAAQHGDRFATAWPVLRFVLNGSSAAYAYSFFAALQPTSIVLSVAVDRVTELTLRNLLGEVDAASPFAPFGAQARPGDYLLVEAPETSGKNVQSVALEFTWQHLPATGFGAYYAGYGIPFANTSFRIGTAYRDGSRWCPAPGLAADQLLFDAGELPGTLAPTTTVHLQQLGYLDGEAAGQFRVQLLAPAAGFGADDYPTALLDTAHYNARYPNQPRALPRAPFVLLARRIQVSYTAEEVIYPARGPVNGGARFYHLHPFSSSEPAAGRVPLLPSLPDEGTLFVGLAGEVKGQNISLVFELLLPLGGEGNTGEQWAAPPQWAYLHQDKWVPIASAPHLATGLEGVASSCAVEVKLPANLLPESQQLPGGLCWLRATVAAGTALFGPVRAIHTQLVRAVRVIADGSAAATQAPLPAGTLTRLTASIPQIGEITQPLPSFGGRAAEHEAAYYRRVSERLRHRNRPVTPADYEHLILELFPEVHSAKCLRPGQLPGRRVPGQVVLVVLPQADAVPGTTLPLFGPGQLAAMQAALQPLLSPTVQLLVRNPTYELIQVRCVVTFNPPTLGPTRLDYPQQLQAELAKILSPWHQADAQYGGFHHHITPARVLAHLTQQPYVATVTGLSLVKTAIIDRLHRFYDSATEVQGVHEISPSVPWAVLVPAPMHMLSEPPAAGGASELTTSAVTTGIGDLRVGGGFVVADGF